MFKSLTTFFNLGRKVPAPGTFGSIIGVIIWLILDYYSFFGFDFSIIIISFIVIFFISANACSKYIISSFNKDPSEIIIDEILAQFMILFVAINLLQNMFFDNYFANIFLYFILFRFFDIKKPFFIKNIEKKFKNGFGIMIDDILAGIYTVIISFLAIF